jgi:hypothetical protein
MAGLYGFIISLQPLLFFLGAKILLPMRYLSSVISGGMKRQYRCKMPCLHGEDAGHYIFLFVNNIGKKF